ncbi:MAG: 8-amino-7-oxononanoate synthase [Elusimicrobia bacterium]|nr:8-amino-7-oxononanoate synthase [Elusimicrobiota bacterium]
MQDFILEENKRLKEEFLWREMNFLEKSFCHEIVLNGKKYINFSSNDYLGYAHHPQVIEKALEALKTYGSGGRSSRLISGTIELHSQLEFKLAQFKRTEKSLIFPTGFMANLGVISALLSQGDAVLMDRLNHASLIDAAHLAGCRIFVYEHSNVLSLEKVLERTKSYKKRLVVTDSLFSMDGDLAPLKEIVELCKKNKVWLMLDDAHATGILGKNGIGAAEHFGVLGEIEIVMGTLSKALGSQGGFVCGSKDLISFLVNRARAFIYTTALAPAACAAALQSLSLVEKDEWGRKRVLKLSFDLQKEIEKRFSDSGNFREQMSQIVPFIVGSAEKSLKLANALKEKGIFAPAIRPPTVPNNESRLRFSITSEHNEGDLKKLVDCLEENLKQ